MDAAPYRTTRELASTLPAGRAIAVPPPPPLTPPPVPPPVETAGGYEPEPPPLPEFAEATKIFAAWWKLAAAVLLAAIGVSGWEMFDGARGGWRLSVRIPSRPAASREKLHPAPLSNTASRSPAPTSPENLAASANESFATPASHAARQTLASAPQGEKTGASHAQPPAPPSPSTPRQIPSPASFAVATEEHPVTIRAPTSDAPLVALQIPSVSVTVCKDNDCRVEPRTLGTTVAWARSVEEASQQAREQAKLVFVIHVSGNFELPEFT